jgi:hypothetical protein
MLKTITRRSTRVAAAAAVAAFALGTPALSASAHVACGKHKPKHTNCGKHKGASKGKKHGHGQVTY